MKKILVAYDGSDPAKRALEQAAELAEAMGGRVTVVSVVPVRAGRARVDARDHAVHTEALEEAKVFLATRQLEWNLLEPAGNPASTIERIVEEGGYDLVILGSRGLGRAERVLSGSVSSHVATRTKSTVVIVH